jgi:O-succinylbenzoic acid--CoA ligase
MVIDFLSCTLIAAFSEESSALLCLPIEYISGKMMVVRSIKRKLNLKAKSIGY